MSDTAPDTLSADMLAAALMDPNANMTDEERAEVAAMMQHMSSLSAKSAAQAAELQQLEAQLQELNQFVSPGAGHLVLLA